MFRLTDNMRMKLYIFGFYDTRKYRYVRTEDCAGVVTIKRISMDYVGTTGMFDDDNWEILFRG